MRITGKVLFLVTYLLLLAPTNSYSAARSSCQMDLERLEFCSVPLERLLQPLWTESERIPRVAFLEGGRNTSLDIAQFINGVLSTEFGDGVLVSSDKGWVESIVYKNTGVEVSIGGGRIPTSEGRRRGAVVPDLVIHLDKDPKVGTFLAPISWNLNRQTRYPKLIVHMGTPSHWNVGYEGKFLIGLSHGSDFEEFGMAPISPETAIEYAKRFYQGKEGGFLSGIRYERWKDKVNIEFNFDPQGGLTEIVVTPIYMPK